MYMYMYTIIYLFFVFLLFSRGVNVGIYTTNKPDVCRYIIEDSRADIVVVEDDKQLQKILSVSKG